MIRRLAAGARRSLRRPRAVIGLVAIAGAVVAGGYAYACVQWRAAVAALARDDGAAALGRLDVPLRVWRYDPEVRRLAGRAARMSGRLELAEQHLHRALALNDGPSDPIRLELMLLRVQTGDLDEVAPALAQAADAGHPEAPLIFDTLALAYILQTRFKPAYACLSRRIELAPTARAYQWRGYVLEKLGRAKAARADYLAAVDLDPDTVPSRLRVAEMLMEDNRSPDAVPHLERLMVLAPEKPEVRARLGMCRFQQGRMDEARELIAGALPELPLDPAVSVTMARLDLLADRPADAERRLRAVLAEDRTDTEALYVLSSALRLQGRADEAAAALADHAAAKKTVDRVNTLLREVVDSPSATVSDLVELGELLVQAGRDTLAVQWLQRAVERNPRHPRANALLADCYERRGDAAAAAAHRQAAR